MELLDSPIRPYAWGSRTAIARLQGRPAPSAGPEAELWLGAHPDSPSALCRGATRVPLTGAIAADPVGLLGESTVARFGARLPFLVKVLAAAEPLSLQAHPTQRQAAAGYAAEQAAGIGQDAPDRNYRDPHHKPELLVAIDDFDALCGFREPARTVDLLAALGATGLESTVDALRGDDPAVALRGAVTGLMALGGAEREALVDAVVAAATERAGARAEYALAVELGLRYPGDIGVVVALLLNQVRLAPGEAVWMPAGNLHAYLRGTGLEIMAASDNVLRGGLTGKHVDVPELLKILRFEPLTDPVVRPEPAGPDLVTWPAPIDDFALYRAELVGDAPVGLPGGGPRIVVCLDGEVRVDDGIAPVTLRRGAAAFGPAGRAASATGAGTLFVATTGGV